MAIAEMRGSTHIWRRKGCDICRFCLGHVWHSFMLPSPLRSGTRTHTATDRSRGRGLFRHLLTRRGKVCAVSGIENESWQGGQGWGGAAGPARLQSLVCHPTSVCWWCRVAEKLCSNHSASCLVSRLCLGGGGEECLHFYDGLVGRTDHSSCAAVFPERGKLNTAAKKAQRKGHWTYNCCSRHDRIEEKGGKPK